MSGDRGSTQKEREHEHIVEKGASIVWGTVSHSLVELVGREGRAAMREYVQSIDREQLYGDLQALGRDNAASYIDPSSMERQGTEIYETFRRRAIRGPFEIPDIEEIRFEPVRRVTIVFDNGARLSYTHNRPDMVNVLIDSDRLPLEIEIYRADDSDEEPFDGKYITSGTLLDNPHEEFTLKGLQGYYTLKRGENHGLPILEKLFDADPTVPEGDA